MGRIGRRPQDVAEYVEHVVAAVEGRRLDGLRVVLDCANGAAHRLAPVVMERLGATVTVIHAEPDGTNINEGCGTTHPASLQEAVVAAGADAGLAFDGDADRLIAVDHLGNVVDGDHVIAICTLDLQARGLLHDSTVVVTVMTNLGFRLAMEAAGVRVVETAVGDRYVLEALAEGSYSIGGEQSGHVIFPALATTGDGLLTGVLLLDTVRRSGRTLADISAAAMTRLPQVLVNVKVARRDPDIAATLAPEIAAAEAGLGTVGRVLVRPSGTEPLIRVMVEAATPQAADAAAQALVRAVEARCGPA